MKIIHESDLEEKRVPGRYIRWIADEKSMNPRYFSSCLIRVLPGEIVKPAHSHPDGEELIYLISGVGQAWVDGEIRSIQPGSAVLFEPGEVHMIRNVGEQEMKVICFFAPATGLNEYRYFDDINFIEKPDL